LTINYLYLNLSQAFYPPGYRVLFKFLVVI
jgi:hypothetical protein